MIINNKVLCLPPYLSTNWENISSIHMKNNLLVVALKAGEVIHIPHLTSENIQNIFLMHAQFLENDSRPKKTLLEKIEIPFHLGSNSAEHIGQVLQHQPEQANMPDLPEDILSKITAITKIIGFEDPHLFPKPEPHCNCMHCQIARAFHPSLEEKEELPFKDQEAPSEEDLKFAKWEIVQTGENLYNVTNRLDSQEKYSVYLGHPVGCTCGKKNCEHVIAVLYS